MAGSGLTIGGLLLGGLVAILLVALIWLSRSAGIARLFAVLLTLLAAVGFAGVAWLLARLRNLVYVLTPEALIIPVLNQRLVIPYQEMTRVFYGLREDTRSPVRERFWPGFHVAKTTTRDGYWQTVATAPMARRVLVETRSGFIAISPERPILFLQDLEQRREAVLAGVPLVAPTTPEEPPATEAEAVAGPDTESERVVPRLRCVPPKAWSEVPSWFYRKLFRRELLGDQLASNLLAVSVILLIPTIAYTLFKVDSVYTLVPIHWDARGEPDQLVMPRGLWTFALLAGGVLTVNTVLATGAMAVDRLLARLLLATTPLVQVFTLVALVRAGPAS